MFDASRRLHCMKFFFLTPHLTCVYSVQMSLKTFYFATVVHPCFSSASKTVNRKTQKKLVNWLVLYKKLADIYQQVLLREVHQLLFFFIFFPFFLFMKHLLGTFLMKNWKQSPKNYGITPILFNLCPSAYKQFLNHLIALQ